MRPRFSVKFLGLVLLGAGLGVSQEGEEVADGLGYRKVGVADCTFERDPGAYLDRVRRHLEQLTADTERVSTGRVKLSAPPSSRLRSGFVNDIPHRNFI